MKKLYITLIILVQSVFLAARNIPTPGTKDATEPCSPWPDDPDYCGAVPIDDNIYLLVLVGLLFAFWMINKQMKVEAN